MLCTRAPLVVTGDNNGTHEYGPGKAAINTNFEHMGVMEQP